MGEELDRAARAATESARTHWRELAVLVASGSLAACGIAGAAALTSSHDGGRRVLLVWMAMVSCAAIVVAYYSITVGATILTGPLRPDDVVSSFVIAGVQISAPLWLIDVARHDTVTPVRFAVACCVWLALLGGFALAASVANWRGRDRIPADVAVIVDEHQGADRREATIAGSGLVIVAGVAAIVSPSWPVTSTIVVALATAPASVGFYRATKRQHLVLRSLVDGVRGGGRG